MSASAPQTGCSSLRDQAPAGLDHAASPPRAKRTVVSLSRLEKKWLKSRICGFCEAYLTGSFCGAHSGIYTLPIIEGVRDEEKVVDLGPPCDMDERRAHALQHYKPRPSRQRKPRAAR